MAIIFLNWSLDLIFMAGTQGFVMLEIWREVFWKFFISFQLHSHDRDGFKAGYPRQTSVRCPLQQTHIWSIASVQTGSSQCRWVFACLDLHRAEGQSSLTPIQHPIHHPLCESVTADEWRGGLLFHQFGMCVRPLNCLRNWLDGRYVVICSYFPNISLSKL